MVTSQEDKKLTVVSEDYDEKYADEHKQVDRKAFSKFIREKRKEYNDKYGKEICTRDLGDMLGIESEMFRKILNQQKQTKKRDCILAICFALRMSSDGFDEALDLYQHMPLLDCEDDPRDEFIVSQSGKDMTVEELDKLLVKRGYPALDIQNKRSERKNPETNMVLPYNVLKEQIKTPVFNRYMHGDMYDSLCTEYEPSEYGCTGIMYLENTINGIRLRLTVSENIYNGTKKYAMENAKNIENYKEYDSLDMTGDFKAFFISIENAITKEKRKIFRLLNDTRNYQLRTSARLINDHVCTFAEEYNYAVPELNEFFVLQYTEGQYRFGVFRKSEFMHLYLNAEDYRKYYGKYNPAQKVSYSSLEEIKDRLGSVDERSDEHMLLKMYIRSFENLKKNVDELYDKIRSRKAFIRNLDYIYDRRIDVLRYYHLEEAFECRFDEMDEIIDHLDSRTYIDENGNAVEITLEDIEQAFELGYEDIGQIIRVKMKTGSVLSALE